MMNKDYLQTLINLQYEQLNSIESEVSEFNKTNSKEQLLLVGYEAVRTINDLINANYMLTELVERSSDDHE